MQKNTAFFSSAHGPFSRVDHILDHKSNFSKFKKIEILSSIFSDHNAIRLDINYKKKTVRNTNTWRFKNVFLNNQQVTEEIKREIDTYTHTQRSTQNGFKDLNIRPETIKILEENIGKTFSDVNHSNILYDPPPRVMEMKAKINNWDLTKLKSFCSTKETISKVKTQPSE